MTNLSLLSRTGLVAILLLSAGLFGEAYAQSATSPAQLPTISTPGAAAMMPLQPAAKLQGPKRSDRAVQAPSGAEVARSMAATVRSRDGKESTKDLPAQLRNKLMSGQKGGALQSQGQAGKLVQIKKTTEYPYTTIGLLANACPGVLVSKRFVLTAGYCVFNTQDGTWYENIDFFPAYDGKNAPYGSIRWKNVYAPVGYTKDNNPDYNFALVELEQDIGDKTGWMGFSHFPEFPFKQLNITGYPYEGVPTNTMWQTTCKVSTVQDGYFFYQCPGKYQTVTAMGGGPVWFKGKGDSDWWVTGIHIGNVDDNKSHWAVRLNEANAVALLSWMQPQETATEEEQTSEDETTTDEDEKVTECTCDQQQTDDANETEGSGEGITVKPMPGSSTQQ
ncbi:MAG: trypsin-like serine protease [Rhizobiales bacterium]|nr:trypsin-like serine protease [Hyphomicrobiales bacterium]